MKKKTKKKATPRKKAKGKPRPRRKKARALKRGAKPPLLANTQFEAGALAGAAEEAAEEGEDEKGPGWHGPRAR